ncbi:adhesion G protein-coupled receptor E1 [Tachysurus fulvidraco]|uniref:adhesion G protein-coupled receptor E1 n=1 Tax=Tachysurus fulvidraco TaxID=1234273 RepID=UPI001FEE9F29|nr:adhesion G protein-coupled receptor E1 [Tachysurus fulvidraco]
MNFLYLLVLALLLVVQTSVTASVNCGLGFIQDKDGCEDDNECEEKEERCGNNSVCYNTEGSYYCQCEPGYKAKLFNFTIDKGGPCQDINECEENKSICGPNAVCSNNAGSYHCSCDTGFVASNGQEHFNTRQSVTCKETKRSSEYITLCVPDADKSSAREQQRFNPTLLTFLLVSHWILKTY